MLVMSEELMRGFINLTTIAGSYFIGTKAHSNGYRWLALTMGIALAVSLAFEANANSNHSPWVLVVWNALVAALGYWAGVRDRRELR